MMSCHCCCETWTSAWSLIRKESLISNSAVCTRACRWHGRSRLSHMGSALEVPDCHYLHPFVYVLVRSPCKSRALLRILRVIVLCFEFKISLTFDKCKLLAWQSEFLRKVSIKPGKADAMLIIRRTTMRHSFLQQTRKVKAMKSLV